MEQAMETQIDISRKAVVTPPHGPRAYSHIDGLASMVAEVSPVSEVSVIEREPDVGDIVIGHYVTESWRVLTGPIDATYKVKQFVPSEY